MQVNTVISASISASVLFLGLFGETTPGSLGFAELAQFLCILVSFVLLGHLTRSNLSVLAIFLSVLVHGLLVSLLMNLEVNNIMRDVIPFIFLLIYYPLSRIPRNQFNSVYYALIFSGVSFTIRYFVKADENIISLVGSTLSDKQYLIQDPAVLFAALFSSKKAVEMFEENRIFATFFYVSLFLICLFGFLLMGVRAGAGLSILYFWFIILRMNKSAMLKISVALLTIFLIVFNFSIFSALLAKFQTFGLNNKDVEFGAVFSFMADSLFRSFFGVGFGGIFLNPVYNFEVRYTHSIITYFYLKLGLLGLFLSFSFVIFYFWQFMNLARSYFFGVFGPLERTRSALWCALVPSIFLQPTYKAYTFALIVSLFLLEVKDARRYNPYKE